MKKIYLLLSMLFVTVIASSQAKDGTVTFKNSEQPAAVIELSYPPNVVTAAMNDYLSKKGKAKGVDIKGFSTFRNTQPLLGDSVNADLYFKIERKSRQEKQVTLVSLLLTKEAGVSGTVGTTNHLSMEQAKTYLDELVPAIDAYNLEIEIKDQNESIIKSESKYQSIISDGNSLEKRKANIEKDIEGNKQDQAKQKEYVENQKLKLSELVGKRKA